MPANETVGENVAVLGRRALRDSTEWSETIEAGWNILVGADAKKIADAMRTFRPEGKRPDLFGDGHAAEKISALLT